MTTTTSSTPTTSRPPTHGGSRPSGLTRLRAIGPTDRDVAARILFEAFAGIHDRHAFPRDFPTLEAATELVDHLIGHPLIWGVVAERDGRVVGSNFLDERGSVTGVGPITVDPTVQGDGVGRQLMEAVMDRAAGRAGIRLLQDAFNTQSLALYASLGFEVEESLVVMGGRPRTGPVPGVQVRPLTHDDLPRCEDLCRSVHGFDRSTELRDALGSPGLRPYIAIRSGRIVAYATTLTHFPAAYAVAETQDDMSALIAGALADTEAPASFLLPTRQHELLRWCLGSGLRIVKPMTYMVIGEHRHPTGAWIPSVLY